jgi:hypothetical protein
VAKIVAGILSVYFDREQKGLKMQLSSDVTLRILDQLN